jgi:hypothetical protein
MSTRTYPELVQGSDEWLEARRGILTASVIGKLITPSTLKPADNETSRGVILTLAAERITGHVEYVHPTFDMQRGTDDEPFAREKYAEHYAPVEEVGFIVRTSDTFTIGYSPDGLVGDDGLIEIKSRKPREQIKTFLTDRVPAYNMAQLQAGLFITGRSWIDYVSYSAGLPMYVKRVYPDTAWHNAITATAERFETEVQTIVNRFDTASTGYPTTERRPEPEEIRF